MTADDELSRRPVFAAVFSAAVMVTGVTTVAGMFVDGLELVKTVGMLFVAFRIVAWAAHMDPRRPGPGPCSQLMLSRPSEILSTSST